MEIRPIRLPVAGSTGPDGELAAYAELIGSIDLETLGTADLARSVTELRVDLAGADEHREHLALGAFEDGALVGMAELEWERDDDASTAYLPLLGVAVSHRRRGIGTRLLEQAERAATQAGRPTLVLSGEHRLDADDGSGARLRAPQGDASIRRDDAAAAFATAHGYALGQLDRISRLHVAGRRAEFAARLSALGDASPFRVATWIDEAPEDVVDSLAHAHERMSVDAPSGAISYELEHWDAERVRADERRCAEMGRITLTAAAITADGTVAGFTVLSLLPGSEAVEQWDTLVLAAHRGHGLGLRLKLANLVQLAEVDEARGPVYTWNADENAHMLAINLALGFEPFALESVWQRP
ncbi:GNAT family N-acetyltransferase [Agromyces agglutinans]|uniref:GNAT family N-acetyltransferase n=1 Tax=Agromyces agglutinans TaxID=2662258 RepID=UPI001299699E|nr:GNAT family N-acetyltransferase [Agromyces agglutinans]